MAKLCRSVCRRHALLDPGRLCGGVAGAIELARRHRLHGVRPGNSQPCGRAARHQVAQQFEQTRRKHHVAVLAAFALLDADEHPLAVDVGDLERDDLGGAQARAIGHAQRRLVLEPGRRIEQPRHLLWLSTTGSLRGSRMNVVCVDDVVPPKRDPEEEPQRRHGVIENGRLRAVLDARCS